MIAHLILYIVVNFLNDVHAKNVKILGPGINRRTVRGRNIDLEAEMGGMIRSIQDLKVRKHIQIINYASWTLARYCCFISLF